MPVKVAQGRLFVNLTNAIYIIFMAIASMVLDACSISYWLQNQVNRHTGNSAVRISQSEITATVSLNVMVSITVHETVVVVVMKGSSLPIIPTSIFADNARTG